MDFVSDKQRKYVMGYVLDGGSNPPNLGDKTVRKGDKGEKVKELQKFLKAQGYYKGEIDGVFGPKTEEAVKNFQKAFRLKQDGLVGKKTKKAINDSFNVDTQFKGGKGTTVKKGAKDWATKKTAGSLKKLDKRWNDYQEGNPRAPKIRITDISKEGGGKYGIHKTHLDGKSVDLGLVNKNNPERETHVESKDYDRETTQKLIDSIAKDSNVEKIIISSKSGLKKPRRFKGEWIIDKEDHKDHIHVTYKK